MNTGTYLNWLVENTKTQWWHDSADPAELQRGLDRGAVGVTTNPFLTAVALAKNRAAWAAEIDAVLATGVSGEDKAEALMRFVVTRAAAMYKPHYDASTGKTGFVCAQVNPSRAGEREPMMAMARQHHAWAPNIAVKLPAVAAGLDVLEDCVAEGITTAATVSFTVPQAVAIAERCRAGRQRALRNGVTPGECFAVIMIGRLDDYLREVAADNRAPVSESDIRQSGLAATKRAYRIYKERGYEAVLLVAALRGDYHLTELAGADLIDVDCPGSAGVVRDRRPPLRGAHRPGDRLRRRGPAPLDARVHQGVRPGRHGAERLHHLRTDAAHGVPVHRGGLEAD